MCGNNNINKITVKRWVIAELFRHLYGHIRPLEKCTHKATYQRLTLAVCGYVMVGFGYIWQWLYDCKYDCIF